MDSIYFENSGVRIHSVVAGPKDGRVVVLLHGFPEFWYGWHKQIEPLAAAGFRVIVPDQRGYNLSSKPRGVASYALKELVYEMRFDEVSARYGEFGPFFVNLRLQPADLWEHLRL